MGRRRAGSPRALRGAALIFRRRSRFDALVQRQLDLFAEDEAELFEELHAAESTYDEAAREDAEGAYGDVQLVLDAGAEGLAELRDTYAATLDGVAILEYEAAFLRAASKRFPRLTGLL